MAGPKEDPTSRCCFSVICFFTLCVGVAVGVVIGMYVLCDDHGDDTTRPPTVEMYRDTIPDDTLQAILSGVSKTKIEDNLSVVREIGGQFRGYSGFGSVVREIGGQFRGYTGFDSVEQGAGPQDLQLLEGCWSGRCPNSGIRRTTVLPDTENPNIVSLLDNTGNPIYSSPKTEKILTPEENKTGVVPPFLAFAKAGVVQGDLVYVNYGRVEDYVTLSNNSINVTNKVVLARYGGIFRGDIVSIASLHGASGVIIYSDPHDYAPDNTTRPYPNSWWLPPSGTQRGTIDTGNGDPLTPGYPATETAYRIQEKAVDPPLPSIPAHAIDAEVAEKILSYLAGPPAPPEWRGDLNVTYNLGPSFRDGMKVQLNVSTRNKQSRISDVVGVIQGAEEPDRYVILGNHRDAWVFGAMDPSGGTAIMLEISRTLKHAINTTSWRPRRSIILCSWDAEEYGLFGSTEFVEEYVKTLTTRAVAYLNVDIAVQGQYSVSIGGSPLLYRTALSATQQVYIHTCGGVGGSLYCTKQHCRPHNRYGNLGSGSDFTNMRCQAGVPVLDFSYIYDVTKWDIASYPLYHSEYETFYAVKNFVDGNFTYHRAIGQLWLALALELTDSAILPFNLSDYAETMSRLKEQLVADKGDVLDRYLPGYDANLTQVIDEFTEAAASFMAQVAGTSTSKPLVVRKLNDQLLQLERAFLDPHGLPGRSYYRHILFAPSSHNQYAAASFPGLVDLLFDIKDSDTSQWEKVKQHFSVILFTIQSATSTLRDVIHFM
ncbi:putative N-acetylated-alpha-linked acidic dipeptidase [Haliotis rubra]|uniref:putative N-acetylated-alpha-linked acidic dipeptidase n=1 Tax=Haliotis rubra TaxID=36100 RepID=UPI001EE5BE55|nr:putative N-acetylated-alpha-linked acidic dipeptidase [Haliotis rubra]